MGLSTTTSVFTNSCSVFKLQSADDVKSLFPNEEDMDLTIQRRNIVLARKAMELCPLKTDTAAAETTMFILRQVYVLFDRVFGSCNRLTKQENTIDF